MDAPGVRRDQAVVRAPTDAGGLPLGQRLLVGRCPAAVDLEPGVGVPDGLLGGDRAYFVSQARRVAFWASCLACLAARFSLRDLLGFLGWLDGVDLDPISPRYDVRER